MSLATRVDQLFADFGEYHAALYEDAWYSVADFGAIRDGIDAALAAAGVAPDAAVGVVLRDRPAGVAAMLTLLAAGRCAVPITPIQPDAPMCDEVASLRLAALVACSDDWARPGLVDTASAVGTAGIELTGDRDHPVRAVDSLEATGAGPHYTAALGVAITI